MYEEILHIIKYVSFSVGVVGISVIAMGAARGLYHYILHLREDNFRNIRYELGSHLILGLDFLVAKDIIDTLLIDVNGEQQLFWMELALLITVVMVRITLTYFTQKELNELGRKKI
ncbi:MAG TPA: DUF1622 domain-containing protein [Candidatus Gracilibacteria bacterium]